MSNNKLTKQPRPFKAYIFFAEAWSALLLGRVILICLPFKKIAPRLRNKIAESSDAIVNQYSCCEETALSVKRACRYAPWRTMCFEQAIAAKLMLNRRKIKSELYFGVYKNEITGIVQAHAWLKCGNMIITGGHNLDKFKIISAF